MHILVEANQIKPVVAKLKNVTGKVGTALILASISIRAVDANTIQLTATDLEGELIVTIPAQVISHGHWAIEAEKLSAIISSAPDGAEISLKLDKEGHRVRVQHGRAYAIIPCLKGEDMTHLNFGDADWSVELSGGDLDHMLGIDTFAAHGSKNPRIYLQGVTILDRAGTLCAWASDGHRAMRAITDLSKPKGFEDPIIVGSNACHRALDLFKDSANVTWCTNGRMMRIEGGAYIFISKLIDGTPPDFERAFPMGEGTPPIKVDREALNATVDSLIRLTSKESKALRFFPLNNAMQVSLPETSEVEGECRMDAVGDATGITIGLNGSYIKDVCKAFDHDELFVKFTGPTTPALFEANNSQRSACIMPIRVQPIDPDTIMQGGE